MVPDTKRYPVHYREPDTLKALCGGVGIRIGDIAAIAQFLSGVGGRDHALCLTCKEQYERLVVSVPDESGTEEEAPEFTPEGPTVALQGGAQVFRA